MIAIAKENFSDEISIGIGDIQLQYTAFTGSFTDYCALPTH